MSLYRRTGDEDAQIMYIYPDSTVQNVYSALSVGQLASIGVFKGRPQPLGVTQDEEGANFSIYAERATRVELLLFESEDALKPTYIIELDPVLHHSFYFWHCYVKGIGPGQVYAYRMDGPSDTPLTGNRFDYEKVLLDPYARANTKKLWERTRAIGPGNNVAQSMRNIVMEASMYDWEDDKKPNTSLADTIIYEMHVRGFTRSHSSGCQYPGTFAGVIEKIPYLQELGITALELLPIFDFDEKQVVRVNSEGKPLYNYWGYDPIGYFALQSLYCASFDQQHQLNEFRDMVKALHRAGIEVFLDVVFNHTSEGNEEGPTINFRGQANEIYYQLSPENQNYYMNFSGCGNTVNTNHPITEKLIIECLTYWATEHHVDGFRFDEASILARGPDGSEMAIPPLLWNIELLHALSNAKIIAEPWDAGGLTLVNRFPGKRWCVWNNAYRDDIRRFVRGDPGLAGAVAMRITGSKDIFAPEEELPINGINFITAHDGFTLYDLVNYNTKSNEANGEENKDGIDANLSWNCGVEGPTTDLVVNALRRRQVKNFATILFLSRGIPMLLGGDELNRTQSGNNNSYCQDNEINWFNWQLTPENTETLRFFKLMIAFRKRFSTLRQQGFFSGSVNEGGLPEVTWHGCLLEKPGWFDANARTLAFTLAGFGGEPNLHVILNMYHLDLEFELPHIDGEQWTRAIDTARPSPEDFVEAGEEIPIHEHYYQVYGYSVAVLISKSTKEVNP